MKHSFVALALAASASLASAATVNVDLSGAATGTTITAPGASFAGTFAGQTVSGTTGINGSPTGPLTLVGVHNLNVGFWDPVVSAASNSILPGLSENSPLSMLFDSLASSLTFTSGSGNGGSFKVDFFSTGGSLIQTTLQFVAPFYSIYSYTSPSAFAGVTISNITDPGGLRFQNFSYEVAAIPLPAGGLLLISGLGLLALVRRRMAV